MTEATVPQAPGDRSYWRAPVIAAALLALALLLTLVPGVLVFPGTDGRSEAELAGLLETQRASNGALEAQIDSIREALDAGLCVDDGSYLLPGGAQLSSTALPAAPPEATRPAPDAVPDASTFDGTLRDLIDEATVSIHVRTRVSGGATREGLGTGFFIAPDLLLTNAHVVGSDPEAEIRIRGAGVEGLPEARVLAVGGSAAEGELDLALLRVSAQPEVPYVALAETQRGAPVVAAGYPGFVINADRDFAGAATDGGRGRPPVLGRGNVTVRQDESDGLTWIYHSAFIDRGNSGGPLFDQCGRVVGVNTAVAASASDDGRSTYGRLGKAIEIEAILGFLATAGVDAPRRATESCATGLDA